MGKLICGNYHSHFSKLVAAWENTFVATITFVQEVSCHTIMIVNQTTKFASYYSFKNQLTGSRVQWKVQ